MENHVGKKWRVEMLFYCRWIELASGFKSRDDAESAVASWKQANEFYGDPFRYRVYSDPDPVRVEEASRALLAGMV